MPFHIYQFPYPITIASPDADGIGWQGQSDTGGIQVSAGGYASANSYAGSEGEGGVIPLPVLTRPSPTSPDCIEIGIPCPPNSRVYLKNGWIMYWTET